MRILQVINSMHTGGAEVLLLQTVQALQRLGCVQEVYLLNGAETPLLHQLRSTGVPVRASRWGHVYHPGQVADLQRQFELQRYDLLHVHLFPAQLWAAMARRLAGVGTPMVTTEHSTHNGRRRALLRPLDSWMYRQYEKVLCISQATEEALWRWVPVVRERTIVVPSGIDLSRFEATGTEKPEIELSRWAGLTAVFTARFEAEKDHKTLLRAVARLPSLRLLLVGDGSRRPEAERLARDLGVADRVVFLGNRTDVPTILRSADLYIHSVHWEGFGLAALEAMATGLPVIASRVPGLTEVVGEAGLYFDPGNVDQLVACIRRIIVDEDLRRTMAEAARRRAKCFSIQEAARRYLEVYHEVVS